jgi:hypothetical protein
MLMKSLSAVEHKRETGGYDIEIGSDLGGVPRPSAGCKMYADRALRSRRSCRPIALVCDPAAWTLTAKWRVGAQLRWCRKIIGC